MQYLFTASAIYYKTPVLYRVSQISQYEYFAEPVDAKLKSFLLSLRYGIWISDEGYITWQAAQIGEKIDRLYEVAMKN